MIGSEKTRKDLNSVTHDKLLRLTTCAVFAAILCLCSHIVIPLAGPVPFALQIFGVMLCGVTLDWATAQLSVLVYLLIGLFLPLFSGGNTGMTAVFGPTGGYIWSYLLMVPVIRALRSIPVSNRWLTYTLAFAGCVLAIALCYLCGTTQFSLITERGFFDSLAICAVPFVGFDLIKAAFAAILGVELAHILARLRPVNEKNRRCSRKP